jgi:hypothetical protein
MRSSIQKPVIYIVGPGEETGGVSDSERRGREGDRQSHWVCHDCPLSDSEGKRPSVTARPTRAVVGRDTTHHHRGLPEGLTDRNFV